MSETDRLHLEAQRAMERGDTLKALTASDELLRRDPTNVDAMFIAGTSMLLSGHEGTGLILLNAARCATKDPAKLGPIWDNIGCALQEYQPEEAYNAFTKALEFGEGRGTFDNLCNVASQIGKHEEALKWADLSRQIDPSHNRSFALMHLGRWAEAWAEFAKCAGTNVRPRTDRTYDLPRWDGKKPGKVIIHGEQGVGDEIMFMSLCPRDFDGVIECNPRNESLFARSFPQARVYGTLLNNYLEWPVEEKADYHLEMGGLGEFYASEPLRNGAFLKADPARMAAHKAWLDEFSTHLRCLPRKTLRVGVAWTGGAWATGRARRSVPFGLIREKLLEQHPDVQFVSLEYEDRREELAGHPNVLNPHWATRKGADVDELAALVSCLDLVITPTNSTVDVCGGLGLPCWVLVDEHPPWRYALKAGEEAMWFYESPRLFRQKRQDAGRWERPMNNLTTALHQMKRARAAA